VKNFLFLLFLWGLVSVGYGNVFRPVLLVQPQTPLPAQVETGSTYTLSYTLTNPNTISQSYLATFFATSQVSLSLQHSSCFVGAPTVLAKNQSCTLTLIFSAGDTPEIYQSNPFKIITVGFLPVWITLSTTIVSPTPPPPPPPPDTFPVTVTVNGSVASESPAGSIPVTMTGNGNTYGPTNITADGSAQVFENMPAGTYAVTVPSTVTVNSQEYELASPVTSFTVTSPSSNLTLTYNAYNPPPPSDLYDWQQSHLTTLKQANVFAVLWGGGDTTAPVNIGSNPMINPWLNAQIATYETDPVSVLSSAQVEDMPSYIAMGTVTQPTLQVTQQLDTQKLDMTFSYEGDGAGNPGCYVGDLTCYTGGYLNPTPPNPIPSIDNLKVNGLASQASTVSAAASHTLHGGVVFYTINASDGANTIDRDTLNDNYLTPHIYNLMIEAQLMQTQAQAGNHMIFFLNPDSGWAFQNCIQVPNTTVDCKVPWKAGLSTITPILQNPNLLNDFNAAVDKMVTNGYLNSGTANTYKTDMSSVISAPYYLSQIDLMYNWIVKTMAPDVPFGWGMNVYDNNYPVLNPVEGCVSSDDTNYLNWQTGSVSWIHKVNYFTPLTGSCNRHEAIQYEADKLASFINDVNMGGEASVAPDFIYFDIYERDPIPGNVSSGFLFNGPDWDSYLEYIKDVDVEIGNLPVAMWQMPGSSLQATSDPAYTGFYAGTMPDWTFGHPTLDNDLSNLTTVDTNLMAGINFQGNLNNNIYFTPSTITTVQDYLRVPAPVNN
jgi:hypothetical protein